MIWKHDAVSWFGKYFLSAIYLLCVCCSSPLIGVGKQNKYRSKEHILYCGEGRESVVEEAAT